MGRNGYGGRPVVSGQGWVHFQKPFTDKYRIFLCSQNKLFSSTFSFYSRRKRKRKKNRSALEYETAGIANKIKPPEKPIDAKYVIIYQIGPNAPEYSAPMTAIPSSLIKSAHTILTNVEYTRDPPPISGLYHFPLISKANSDITLNHKFINSNHFILLIEVEFCCEAADMDI